MKKRGRPPKTDRNTEVIKYHRKHPQKNLAQIGEIFGLTKQRIFKILKQYG